MENLWENKWNLRVEVTNRQGRVRFENRYSRSKEHQNHKEPSCPVLKRFSEEPWSHVRTSLFSSWSFQGTWPPPKFRVLFQTNKKGYYIHWPLSNLPLSKVMVLERDYSFRHQGKWHNLPLVNSRNVIQLFICVIIIVTITIHTSKPEILPQKGRSSTTQNDPIWRPFTNQLSI